MPAIHCKLNTSQRHFKQRKKTKVGGLDLSRHRKNAVSTVEKISKNLENLPVPKVSIKIEKSVET
jgi:hypothetical protein